MPPRMHRREFEAIAADLAARRPRMPGRIAWAEWSDRVEAQIRFLKTTNELFDPDRFRKATRVDAIEDGLDRLADTVRRPLEARAGLAPLLDASSHLAAQIAEAYAVAEGRR